ncbi:MAG: hypothetical protein ABIP79_04040 [Chitinophagaceae bacterium]
MRILILISLLSFTTIAFSQSNIIGHYKRLDSKIWINADSTFKFWYSVDTYRGWAMGKWKTNGKKIFLTAIPIYDTISVNKDNLYSSDSIFLSQDFNSERIIPSNTKSINIFKFEQNFKLCPDILLYKKGTLFIIKKGKKEKKKINNGYYIKPFNPWYTIDNNLE